MRRVRKTGTKEKAALCQVVSVHPGSPLAESGLVCRDLLGRSFYYSPLWTCLLQSRNRASLGKPLKTGVWSSAPVRCNISFDYLLCSCVTRPPALPDFATWTPAEGRRQAAPLFLLRIRPSRHWPGQQRRRHVPETHRQASGRATGPVTGQPVL